MFNSISKYLIFCIIFCLVEVNLQSQDFTERIEDETNEGIFQVKYENVVDQPIIAKMDKKSVYLPFLQMIDLFKIKVNYDSKKFIVSGFFVNEDSTYTINFKEHKATFNDREIKLDSTNFFVSESDIYVLPALFKKVFNLNVEVNYSKLTVMIGDEIDLPVYQEYLRKKKYAFLESKEIGRQNFFPLEFGRSRKLINGGIIDYRLKGSQIGQSRSYSWFAKSGIEFLGGDLTFNTSGSHYELSNLTNYQNTFRWRYYFSDNSYLTQVEIGELYSGGYRYSTLPTEVFYGITITNEQTQQPTYFGELTIDDHIDPGWEVELYRNGHLYDRIVTDPSGYYKFNIPVNYGSSNLEMRYYGKNGEYYDRKTLLRIPREILRPGEVKYSLNVGETRFDREKFGEGRLSVGIFNWLSNTVLFKKFYKRDDYTLINSLSANLFSNLTTTFDINPEKYYRLDLDYWPLEFGSYRFSYINNQDESELSRYRFNSRMDLMATLPRIKDIPVSLSVRAGRLEMDDFNNNTINARSYVSIYPFNFIFSYSAFFNEYQGEISNPTQYIDGNIRYSWFKKGGFLSFLKNTQISLGSSMDLSTNSISHVTFSISQSLGNLGSLSIFGKRDFRYSNSTSISAILRLDLPYFMSKSEAQGSSVNRYDFSQEIEGTIGYLPMQGDILISNPSSVNSMGDGAANIRLFLDKNQNGEYDKDEKIIEGVGVSVPNGSVDYRSASKNVQVYNLTPYYRYNVKIDETSIKNPLWTPTITEFSFIADPNTYKQIDIPCYAGAVIEGQVRKIAGDQIEGQSGVKVHIVNSDETYHETITVFSDGSFYKMGVPPGEYKAYVDSMQMAILNVKPEKEHLAFNVERTTEGDFVEGLQFDLVAEDYARRVSVEKAAEKEKEVEKEAEELAMEEQEAKKLEEDSVEESIDDFRQFREEKFGETEDLTEAEESKEVPPADVEPEKSFRYEEVRGAGLTGSMRKYLDDMARYMKQNPEAEVRIIGHTDNFGTLRETQKVSEDRVNAAVKYMTGKGISKYRIYPRAMGARKPVASNDTEEGRAKNRRLEIQIVE